jgi:capsular polysaccharide biosynthesis protein
VWLDEGTNLRLAIRVFTVLALGAIAAAAAAFVTYLQPVQYRATSVLLIPGAGTRADNETVVRSLEALLVSPPVAADIAARSKTDLTSGQVVERMTVTRPPDSAVLEVSILDTDTNRSAALAREAGPALVTRLNAVAGGVAAQVPAIAEYTVVAVNEDPVAEVVAPPRARNGVIGLGLGLLLGAGLAFWRPRRSRPIRSETEAAEAFDTPLYATLPILGSGSWRAHSLDVPEDRLPIGWPPAAHRLVVLGTGGRASVRLVQLLASAIAQSGRDVLLIDAEPEERGLTAAFGQIERPGFFDCLSSRQEVPISSVLVELQHLPREMADLVAPNAGRISLMPAGEVDVVPSALAGGRVTQALRRVHGSPTIIVHAPRQPGPYPANQFVEFADAVIVSAVAGRTRVEEAEAVSRLVTSLTPAPMYAVLLTDEERRGAPRSGASRSHNGHRHTQPKDAADPAITTASTTT